MGSPGCGTVCHHLRRLGPSLGILHHPGCRRVGQRLIKDNLLRISLTLLFKFSDHLIMC